MLVILYFFIILYIIRKKNILVKFLQLTIIHLKIKKIYMNIKLN
jgi:hypothetical protein